MLAFYFRSLSFQPPLKTQKKFYLSLEVVHDSSQTTEIFTYNPHTNSASLSETLEFLVKDAEKSSQFTLELCEFDNPTQRHMKVGKDTIQLSKIVPNIPKEITIPTIYGTDAIVDLTIEVSDEFKESSADPDSKNTTPKKRRHRHLEKLFNKERFSFLKLNKMSYESVFGLTPVVQTLEAFLEFIRWKNPHITFGVSMLLTFFIMHGQGLLAFAFLGYYIFYKRVMPILLEPAAPEIYQQSRLTTYKQNFIFFKEASDYVSQGYEIYKKLFLDEDRTMLIQLLLFIRKFSPVVVFVLLAFDFRHMIVMGYWALLIYNTKIGKETFKRGYEESVNLMSLLEVRLAPILSFEAKLFPPEKPQKTSSTSSASESSTQAASRTSLDESVKSLVGCRMDSTDETRASISDLLPTPPKLPRHSPPKMSGQLFREKSFIIFENQRWWPGKGWRAELLPGDRPAWSDDLGQVELKKENFKLPGSNWQWEREWNIVMSFKTDEEGWEYASRFKKFEDPERKKSLIHSVRRRKWIRKCIEFDD